MLLEFLRHGGMAYMAGVLQWMNTGSSGKTGRKDEGQWVALYLKNQVKCTELFYGMDDRQVESFLVRIRQEASSGDSVVGICYRPPNQYEELLSKVPRAIRISFTQASFVSNIFQSWGRTWQYRLLPISDTSAAHKQKWMYTPLHLSALSSSLFGKENLLWALKFIVCLSICFSFL